MTFFSNPKILDAHRWRGLRVGLLGGSFNPPHAGHLHISNVAMKALHLDCVWWLVTPQNPFKDSTDTMPFDQRMGLCEDITAGNPRIIVSDLENQFGSVRTAHTMRNLRHIYPFTEFVFLAGSDVLYSISKWHRWRDIPQTVAVAFVARPPALSLIRHNPLRLWSAQNHHVVSGATKSELKPGNCFWIWSNLMNPMSSSEIRRLNKIGRG